jgi:hypothetical protein
MPRLPVFRSDWSMIHKWQKPAVRWAAGGLAACLVCTMACGVADFIANNTASLGGTTPGGRGNLYYVIVNNTGFFVSMTFGNYDPLYETLAPQYQQFFADADHPDTQRLEPGASSDTFQATCTRAISLGDRGLITAIRERDPEADLETLKEGITFSDKLLSDPTAQQFTLNGVANQVQLHGVNYQCESLVVFTFEQDATQPYGVRIDVDVLLP